MGQVGIHNDPYECFTPTTISANNTDWIALPNDTLPLIYLTQFDEDKNVVKVLINSTNIETLSVSVNYAVEFAGNSFCTAQQQNGTIELICNDVPKGKFYLVMEGAGGAFSG